MNIFTAHVRVNDGKAEVQTVSEHCKSTAVWAEKYAGNIHAPCIAKLQATIHDWGKLCRDFDDYIQGNNNYQRGMIDHCYAGARYLTEFAKQTKDAQLIETAEFIARTVISHHGLHDWVDENGENYFFRRISKEERYAEIKGNIRCMMPDEELMKLLTAAKDEYAGIRYKIRQMCAGDKAKEMFAFYMGQFERLIQSVLIDADRTDTAEFQLNSGIELDFDREIWDLFYENIEAKTREFGKREDTISKLRSSISDRCKNFAEHEVGICRLIVPTGGGKTLSSLRFAIHYCKRYGKEHIFYVAPYQSILDQNSDVLKEIIGEKYLLEHHSDIVTELGSDDEIAEYELRSDKWDMPVIATTMVQFLNTFFLDRLDSVRRMHRLCNSVIIIDEVQSIPTKCVSLFNLAMNFMSKIGGSSIVLCSATQPTFEKVKYPLKVDENGSMTGDYSMDFLKFRRNRILPKILHGGYSYEQAADFCMEKYKEEGNVLFVVNTKTAAARIFQEIKKKITDDTKVVHLSTNMCPQHRRAIIKDLKEMLKCNQKVICVTTQLIEAGVDISFRCVIRSLAGLDNAVQAAGRCNRSGEYEQCCNVYLLNLNEERLGNLKEIRTGQNVARQMIGSGRYSDLQSVETLRDFFEKYYREQSDEMEYNAEDMGVQTDLLNLLSINKQRCAVGTKHNGNFYARQAFQTAGKIFHVIDDNSISVLVPYNDEAKEIIACLQSGTHIDELIKTLRKAQKYTVGLYEQTERKLKDKYALDLLPCDVYVLDERYYDSDYGIQLDGKPMDLLVF